MQAVLYIKGWEKTPFLNTQIDMLLKTVLNPLPSGENYRFSAMPDRLSPVENHHFRSLILWYQHFYHGSPPHYSTGIKVLNSSFQHCVEKNKTAWPVLWYILIFLVKQAFSWQISENYPITFILILLNSMKLSPCPKKFSKALDISAFLLYNVLV